MLRAAARGVIDFEAADPLDPGWWKQTQLLLTEVAREAAVSHLSAKQTHVAALLSHGNLAGDGFNTMQEQSSELLHKLQQLLQPWIEEDLTSRVDDLASQYEETFGRMDSTEHKEKEARLLAWFEKNLRNPPDDAA